MVEQGGQLAQVRFSELCHALWRGKWIIFPITLLGMIGAVIYASSLPNIYRSEVLLTPAESSVSNSQFSQLGGVAALAGINLGGGGNKKTTIALEIIQSREFITNFIDKYSLLKPLLALKSWDRLTNQLEYDSGVYDIETSQWVRDVEPPKQLKPSLQEAYLEFMLLFSVEQRKDSGTVLLSMEHYSPYIAKEWLDLLVHELNAHVRELDIKESNKSLEYLKKQLKITDIEELKVVLYRLIEEQTKTLMLAQIADQYVFKVIDPPIVSELKHKPKRALICVVISLFSIILSGFIVLLRFFSDKERQGT